jgi:hypothetical protein
MYEESFYALPITVESLRQFSDSRITVESPRQFSGLTSIHLHRRQANRKSGNREDQSQTKDSLLGGAAINGG